METLVVMKEKKTKIELKRGLQGNGQRWSMCNRCKNTLGAGPRWWVCEIPACRKECRSAVHKGWGRKEKDDDSVVGEENV
jgi:hypothetical protein